MRLRITVILFAVALALAGYTLGQAVFTEFTGTEAAGGYPDFSTTIIKCPGGEPTGAVFPSPCTPAESRVHIRGAVFPYILVTDDPRLTGAEEVTMNGNFDGWKGEIGPGSGEMWGTLRIVVMEGTPTEGIWEGVWTGTRTVNADNTVQSVIHAVAHGTEGSVEGLQANWNVTLDPVSNVGVCQGRILAPPRKGR